MSLPVFFIESLAGIVAGSPIELTGAEARHAVVVRRIRPTERVMLTDGKGTSAECEVTAVGKAAMAGKVVSHSMTSPELPRVTVVQAIPKGDRGERAVEMLTEVGADVIVPWAAARSVAVWREERAAKSLARWRSTAHEAAKQARRTWFPAVTDMASTNDVVTLLSDASVRVVLHEATSRPAADVPVSGRGDIVIVVGPEGGITADELAVFAGVGAEPVRLGSSVLRTSTAGVVATAALLSRTPRWR